MEFCQVCDNLIYLKTEEDGSLVQYCKHCLTENRVDSVGGRAIRVSETMYSEDDFLYMQQQGRYLRHDPTLPRVQDPRLLCPNKECPASREAGKIIYVKYHPVHMRYFYTCEQCSTSWRNDDNSKK